jgi:uncharacterized coiled-coil protein SlyX
VALTAIRGLSQTLDEQNDRIEELESENEQLRERLASIENHRGIETISDQAPPADDY